jgi:primosomal protein N' (replication factor Y)
VVSTGDKDLAQLVNQHVRLVNTMTNETLDVAGVIAKFGVPPERIIDYLTLIGDAVDNVPGVEKCGPKTAVKWLTQFGDLDGVIAHAGEISGVVGENLRRHLDFLPLGKKLVTVDCAVALPVALEALAPAAPDAAKLIEIFAALEFKTWLREAMDAALAAGRQVILFQNRRGYAPVWQCGTCGHAPLCERCDVPMTHHKALGELHCHHCGYRTAADIHCPACGRPDLGPRGLGTERVEEELAEFFPEARVARMDADTTRSRHAHGRLIEAFSRREFDVLIGTQMVTKGLDFAHVGVVGVLNADRMLTFPDFRSFERAYQMLTQVAGRAGRTGRTPSQGVPSNLGGAAAPVPGGAADPNPNLNLNPVPGAAAPNLNLNPVPSGAAAPSPGTVIIQTSTPDHWVLNRVVAGDYDGLVQQELFERAAYGYPPFHRLIRITLKHSDLNRLERGAAVLATRLRDRFAARCIGPETPAIGRIDDLHIRVILLKFERAAPPARYKAVLREDLREFHADPHWKRLRLTVDVDPA